MPKPTAMVSLRWVITALRRHYGEPPALISKDPFRLILWEQVAYLVPDAQRRRAFAALQTQVGLAPEAIAAASSAQLERITRLGGSIAVASRAARLRESAELVLGRWNGDLRAALRLDTRQARRALEQFPMIGEPGADKVLVATERARLLPLDSNALRVLERLGLAPGGKDYRSAYRRAQEAVAPMLPRNYAWLVAAYSLLRTHGQELCRRRPACSLCPLRLRCPSSTIR